MVSGRAGPPSAETSCNPWPELTGAIEQALGVTLDITASFAWLSFALPGWFGNTDAQGAVQLCHTTSWGVSTRVVGGLVSSTATTVSFAGRSKEGEAMARFAGVAEEPVPEFDQTLHHIDVAVGNAQAQAFGVQ